MAKKLQPLTRAFTLVRHPILGWLMLYGGKKWQVAGGRIDTEELPAEAALRELREETGVSARIEHLVAVTTVGHRALFLLSLPLGPVQIGLSSEHSSFRWSRLSDLRSVSWLKSSHLVQARRLHAQGQSPTTP